jgi:hypothetical protein
MVGNTALSVHAKMCTGFVSGRIHSTAFPISGTADNAGFRQTPIYRYRAKVFLWL